VSKGDWSQDSSIQTTQGVTMTSIIAVDVVALYGLCAYGSRAALEAA
jgi:hypothetical protein